MSYFGINSDSAASFFSGYFGASDTSASGVNLGDWTMIKSGAYKKLLSAYYAKEGNDKKTSSTSKDSSTTAGDSSVKVSLAANDAQSLVDATGKLSSSVKNQNSTSEDMFKAASDFVKSYNSLVKSSSDVDNNSILRSEINITKNTKANDDLLKDVGISIGSDNTLSIDETKFKAAKRADLKALFTGYSSYASHVSSSAGNIYNTAKAAVATTSKACSYTNSGSYSKLLSNVSSYNRSI